MKLICNEFLRIKLQIFQYSRTIYIVYLLNIIITLNSIKCFLQCLRYIARTSDDFNASFVEDWLSGISQSYLNIFDKALVERIYSKLLKICIEIELRVRLSRWNLKLCIWRRTISNHSKQFFSWDFVENCVWTIFGKRNSSIYVTILKKYIQLYRNIYLSWDTRHFYNKKP